MRAMAEVQPETSAPARNSDRIVASLELSGPSVATILAWRLRRMVTVPRLEVVLLCLGWRRLHRCLYRLFVAQVVIPDRFEVLVQLVEERLSCRDVELDDVLIGHRVQVLDQRPKAVAMGGNQNALSGSNARCDRCMPEREEARHCISQAFRAWECPRLYVAVARITAFKPRIIVLQHGWPYIVGASPGLHLRLSKLGRSFRLVEALQGAVMALVQAPRVMHWD